ncbi:porin family protein [Neorhizobium sp. P12A]|jgi:lipid A oxidase|uniref:outer membrane protein n=1 Tax=Rhizobium/Agrobacterium group TaxID=227290 RepID=UPI001042E57E|nr:MULTISPECIES: outer membrane beta-barrel protein [Rhizobium/Agrobacterium group]KAA0699615.1 porin family protein [Neorhizobium sp. P12A]TCR91239.1 lipid A oxidase [Rhizobium sp. BK376]
MNRACRIRQSALAALTLAALVSVAGTASAEMQLSIYGGVQGATGSNVKTSDGADFDPNWSGKSFANPPYYGIRGTWWLDDLNKPDWGISLDYTHAKVYGDLGNTPGWSHFEFTDGLNLLTVNGLYRFQDPSRKWTPYVGLGAGINVPHVEVTRASGRTFDYEFGGLALQAQAGVSYQITKHWSTFLEYKGNYSFVNDVPIDSGATLKTNVFTNALNFGVSFNF